MILHSSLVQRHLQQVHALSGLSTIHCGQCFLLEGWSNLKASGEETSCEVMFPDLVHYVQLMLCESWLLAAFRFIYVYADCGRPALPLQELVKPKLLWLCPLL